MTKEIELTGIRLAYARLVGSIWQAEMDAAKQRCDEQKNKLLAAIVEDITASGEVPPGLPCSVRQNAVGILVLSVEVPDIKPDIQPDA